MREFAAAGPAELLENGARIAPLSTLSWEVRGKSEKPLLHLGSENHNLTRRVLAITDHSGQRLALAVECFGRAKPDRLEFLRIEFDRSARELSRGNFAQPSPFSGRTQFPPQPLLYGRVILAVQVERLFLVSFSVKIRHRDQVALIDVSGHLTFFEVGALRQSVETLLKAQRKNIVLNLSELKYLDSSGIGELARIYVAVVKQGGAMKVIGLSAKVEEILKITHLSQVFQEFPDEQSALQSFPA